METLFRACLLSLAAASLLFAGSGTYNENEAQGEKPKKTSEAERGYTSTDIQKGWAFGDDASFQNQDEIVPQQVVKKTKRDAATILEEILIVQKEQLKEQKKIREILEEQYDPKPKVIVKADGTKCIANSSADCFDFPLIAEAKRIPVMANHFKNPHDSKATAEWKKWYATYLNHNFDIGKAWEYDSAENGSNSFKTDFKRDGFDSAKGDYYVEKEKHNTRIINAFGTRGLSLKILLGKTPELDLYAMDQIAMFIRNHPSLAIELVFSTRESAEVYKGGARAISFVEKAFSQSNVTKRLVSSSAEFPVNLQATPAYQVSYKDGKRSHVKIIKSGKVESGKLSNSIIEWMIFEKIVDPAQLNDSRIWKDAEGIGNKFIKDTYGKDLYRGGR